MLTVKEEIRRAKTTRREDLQLILKDNLVVTSMDGEGIVFEPDTRKNFWVNEVAVFFLGMLQVNREGVFLSSARGLLQEHYSIDNEDKIVQDFTPFIDQLERYGLVFFQLSSNGKNETKPKNPNGRVKRPYLKPIIKEEITDVLSVVGAIVSAARASAARSAAVSRATAAGFQGFR